MFKKVLWIIATSCIFLMLAISLNTVGAANEKTNGYEVPVDIVLNGEYLYDEVKGRLGDDGIVYVPLRNVSNVLGLQVTWNDAVGAAVLSTDAYTLVFVNSEQCCYVNNYWHYAPQKIENGVLHVSAKFLFENLGAQVVCNTETYEVTADLPGVTVAQEYIETDYNAEDLYWLTKIVTCEAGSVSFDARIMVANVIINRRESSMFPDNIHDVIFDKKFGIQFSPAHNGKIEKAVPVASTVLACKAALNGTDLAPDCLYFNYASNKTGWVARNRVLYKVIGKQAFYL